MLVVQLIRQTNGPHIKTTISRLVAANQKNGATTGITSEQRAQRTAMMLRSQLFSTRKRTEQIQNGKKTSRTASLSEWGGKLLKMDKPTDYRRR